MIGGAAPAMPAGAVAVAHVSVRRRRVPPRHRPLSAAEQDDLYDRITKRIGRGGPPFGVFVLKQGRGRIFKLLSNKHHDYAKQLGREEYQRHMISTYDARVSFADVWADLCAFGRSAAA